MHEKPLYPKEQPDESMGGGVTKCGPCLGDSYRKLCFCGTVSCHMHPGSRWLVSLFSRESWEPMSKATGEAVTVPGCLPLSNTQAHPKFHSLKCPRNDGQNTLNSLSLLNPYFSQNDQEMEILNSTMMWLLCLPHLKQEALSSPIRLVPETFQLDSTHHHQQTFHSVS